MIRKYVWLLLLLLTCCTNPVGPVNTDVITVEPSQDSAGQYSTDYSISRYEYELVTIGMDKVEFRLKINKKSVMEIKQPDGGVAFRFQVTDSDGLWRGRHATFVFSVEGKVIRKVIS